MCIRDSNSANTIEGTMLQATADANKLSIGNVVHIPYRRHAESGAGITSNVQCLTLNAQDNPGSNVSSNRIGDRRIYCRIRGASGTQYFRTPSANQLVIKSDGKIGIGTAAPASILHVAGGSSPTILNKPSDASPAYFVGDSNRTGAGQHLAEFKGRWNGNDVARIVFLAGADTTNKDDGVIRVDTTPSGGSSTERLRIDSSGNIGAGTNSPSSFSASDFVISKSANAGMTISVGNAGTTNTASIFFAEGTGGTGDKERGAIKYKHGDDYLAFHTNYDERLRILSNGKVGIGTGIPDQTLEIFKETGTNLAKITSQANSTIGIELEKTGATTQSWRIADGQTINGALELSLIHI